ncbi:MAG: diacylglycerol kinase family lipid kinase [Blastocatellia bacterium]|nr:diacylglycerol kinase family lipid kinase [Blastocatellia bacterium]
MDRSALVIYNPKSGRSRERSAGIEEFLRLLAKKSIRAEVRATEQAGHASILAREAVEQGFDLIVANGGDGTLNEVLQGIVGSSTALAVWPGGTANVVALDLKLPRKPDQIVELIASDSKKRVNVGRAGSRYFFFTAGIGLDAEIINRVSSELKKQIGKGAFWLAGFSHLIKWEPTTIFLEIDGKEYEGTFVVIGKSFGYGGTLSLTPHARLDDPHLDVCIFSGKSKLQYLNYLVAAIQKEQLKMEGVTYLKTEHVKATSTKPLPIQVDGEVVCTLPTEFEVVKNAVTLYVPNGVL